MKPEIQQPLEDWLQWLMGLHAQEIDLGLSRIKQVADRMGLLQPKAKVITVAGTNGKGSSVAMLASIYHQAGIRVGHYTSPHLLKFNERIQINQMPVTDLAIKQAFDTIDQARGETKLTYFEFTTLAALWIFTQAQVDLMILEVGLGGRLDAVNILDADAALITAIDIDHGEWLGSDREQIGQEKAGILRANQWAVCSDPQPPQSVQHTAAALKTPLWCLHQHFTFQPNAKNIKNVQNSQSCQDFIALDEAFRTIPSVPAPALKGAFQWQNLAGVCAVVQGLSAVLPVSDDALRQGVQQVRHPGRLQWLSVRGNQWLVDVAHNAQSVAMLQDYVSLQDEFFSQVVFSVLADKAVGQMVAALKPFVAHWHIAAVQQPRAMSVEEMQQALREAGVSASHIHIYATVAQATEAAMTALAGEELQKGLVMGSFFTLAEALPILEANNE